MSDKCPKCAKTAYPMESVKVEGETYHKTCFRCHHCSKRLSPQKFSMINHNPYCKTCYGKLFRETGGSYDKAFGGGSTRKFKKKAVGHVGAFQGLYAAETTRRSQAMEQKRKRTGTLERPRRNSDPGPPEPEAELLEHLPDDSSPSATPSATPRPTSDAELSVDESPAATGDATPATSADAASPAPDAAPAADAGAPAPAAPAEPEAGAEPVKVEEPALAEDPVKVEEPAPAVAEPSAPVAEQDESAGAAAPEPVVEKPVEEPSVEEPSVEEPSVEVPAVEAPAADVEEPSLEKQVLKVLEDRDTAAILDLMRSSGVAKFTAVDLDGQSPVEWCFTNRAEVCGRAILKEIADTLGGSQA